MNTTGIPKSLHPQLPHICQHHTTTGVLLILRASHTCKHNFYTRTATESTRKLSAQQGRSDHIWGAVRSFAPGNQELNKKTTLPSSKLSTISATRSSGQGQQATKKSWRKTKLSPNKPRAVRSPTQGGQTAYTKHETSPCKNL
jgi:hypothetical protein